MPYELNSPLAAGAGALAGYVDATNKRKRQSVDDARQARLDAQAQADTSARLGLERSNQDATNAYRKTQQEQGAQRLDIERGNAKRAEEAAAQTLADKKEADRRQKIIDTFQGQGLKYPPNWDKKKPEEKIAYLQVRLDKAMKAGDPKTATMTEGEINKVATEAEQARRDARQAKVDAQHDKDNAARLAQGNRRINISLDRGNAATSRATAAAGDPQSLADVSGRLSHAKTRDQAQSILDSPEGSLLSDRQYARLQKQVDETYGSHAETHKPTKATATQKDRHISSTEMDSVQGDADEANDAVSKKGDKNKIRDHFKRKWALSDAQAASFIP